MSSTANKILALGIIFIGVVAFLYFLKNIRGIFDGNGSIPHKIESLSFEATRELELVSSGEITGLKNVNLFSDMNEEYLTYCLIANTTTDSASVVDAYSLALEGLLSRHSIDPENLKMDDITVDGTEMAAIFSYDIKRKPVLGFGFLRYTKNKIESLWLVPVTKGFDSDYIAEFKKGIDTESIRQY
jgi:hypothetical protein